MAQNMPLPGIGSYSAPGGPPVGAAAGHMGAQRAGSRCSSRPSSSSSLTTSRLPNNCANPVDYCVFGAPPGSNNISNRVFTRTNKLAPLKRPGRSSVEPPAVSTADGASNLSGFLYTPRSGTEHSRRTPYGLLQRSSSEECLKCMLKVPHQKCEAHKYIRIGGGYRHSYWYVKAMLEELELRRQKELLLQQRLEAIHEQQLRAIKTYIRTKSGKLRERIIFLSEEDYAAFKEGGGRAEDILKKYLSKEEANNLQCWDEEEQKAMTTFVRTKSGRLVKKTVYVSKAEYDAIKDGRLDAKDILKRFAEDGERIEGWEDAEMKAIKTKVRTKSGRLIEKTIMVSKEDYDKLMELERQGKLDPDAMAEAMQEILGKYMSVGDGETIEGWRKHESAPMKVIKTMIRTKSGRLVEKTILMTEEEYADFQASGGDTKMLRKYLDIDKDDVIEDWDKQSTVYSASGDEAVDKAIPGSRIVGKDGNIYEVVVDPITGKKYKKKVALGDSGIESMVNKTKGKIGKGRIVGADDGEDPHEAKMSKEQKAAYRAGIRREDSDSDFSYRSVVSAGGTRHVRRRHKRADGTYSDSDSYNSDADEAGKARRQKRRTERKVKAIKAKKERLKQGKRNDNSDSDFSYRSVVSAGGTRHVRRRRKKADGTYSGSDSYHSSQDEMGQKRRKKRRQQKTEALRKGKRNQDSDSDFSYRSVVSAGGTRHVRRKKKQVNGTYGDSESFHSSEDEAGQSRRRKRRGERQTKYKEGKRRADSDSDYSYRSIVSAGGTRRVRRKKKNADGTYADSESYQSSQDEGGEARRRRRRRDRKHVGSAHSYFSVTSEGGTRHIRRKKKHADGTYSSSESYHSDDSDFFADGKGKKKRKKKKRREHGSDSDYSYVSEVSAGGTRRRGRHKRIRDAHGKVIGHGQKEDYTSPSDSDESGYALRPDGKGGFKKVKKKKGRKGDLEDYSDSMLSTDSEDEPDLTKMTKKEREEYLEARAKRKADREKKRKEKYGSKYEEMAEKHKKAKAAKSMVSYQKGGRRFKDGEWDDRQPGLGHDGFGGKKGKKKGNDSSDSEEYLGEDGQTRRRKKKDKRGKQFEYVRDADGNILVDKDGKPIVQQQKGGHDSDEESIYEFVKDKDGQILRDRDGNPIKRKVGTMKKPFGKNKKGRVIDTDGEFEYLYDDDGNLVRRKKGDKMPDEEDSDGDYFETLPDGTIRMKKNKKKIDISKLTDDDLRRLGLDPRNMTKEQIARALKERFGDNIKIMKGTKKIGLKSMEDFGSDADTDELADDSDLDISTLTGQKRVRVLMKRGGPELQAHMKKVIANSKLTDEPSLHPEERDASIDFMKHYQLVEPGKIDTYAKVFVVEDDDLDCLIYSREAKQAIEIVPSVRDITKKQMDYILKVLDIDRETNVTFRMFAVMTALAERVTAMDKQCKHLLEISDLADIERKMALYKAMFYCNVPSDRDHNYIESQSLMIELIAGGLNWQQQDFILSKMTPNEWDEISFLDYLAYIPLFLSMHDNVCSNPLDMSLNKYSQRKPSGAQRDMNPLGFHLNKQSVFLQKDNSQPSSSDMHKKAVDLLAGKEPDLEDNKDLLNKYQKLPHIIGSHENSKTNTNRFY